MNADNPYSSPAAEPAIERPVAELHPPQSVKYQITVEDVETVSEKVYESMPSLRQFIRRRQRIYFVGALAFLVLAAFAFYLAEGLESIAAWLGVMAIVFTLIAIRFPQMSRRNSKQLSKQMMANEYADMLDKTFTATLFEEGIQFEDEDGHSFHKWHSIARVDNSDTLLFVFVNPAQIVSIPSRAFFNEVAFKGFCQLAERLWRESQDDAESSTR